jgi:uncharacterized protein (DUF433 family)
MLSLRAITAKFRSREYSTSEASAITGVPLNTINHYISRELAPLGVGVWGDGKRSLSYEGLVALRMAHTYPKSLAPNSRVIVIEKALRSPRKKHLTLDGGKVIVRIDTARQAVAGGLQKLHQAEAGISVDISIMKGEPCIKGTRIPVYVVAGIANSEGIDEARIAYSRLSNSQISAACLYAKAHPRRGRPKRVGDVLAKIKPKRSKTISVRMD